VSLKFDLISLYYFFIADFSWLIYVLRFLQLLMCAFFNKPLQYTTAMPTADGRRVSCRRPSGQADPTAAVGVAPSA
jgi:hypothetical protein